MVDIRYLKTNYYFLGFLFMVLSILIFSLLYYLYPMSLNRNIPISILIGLILVIGLYYIPLKLPKLNENFDDN